MTRLFIILLFLSTISMADVKSTNDRVRFDIDSNGVPEMVLDRQGLGVGKTSAQANLDYSGTLAASYQTVSDNQFSLSSSLVLLDSSSGDLTIPLPNPAGIDGYLVTFKKISSNNNVVLSSNVGFDASTQTTLNLTEGFGRLQLLSIGTRWSILHSSDNLSYASWSPTHLDGLIGWYDASDAGSLTLVSGNVSVMTDKSGLGNDFAQASGTEQPASGADSINGLNTITFDGTDDTLETATNPIGATISDAMLLMVCNIKTITASSAFTLSRSASARWQSHLPWSDGQLYFDVNGTNGEFRIQAASGLSANDNVMMGYYSSVDDDVQEVYKNGSLFVSDDSGNSAATSGGFVLGSQGTGAYDNIAIGEVIILNSSVTDVEREIAEGYLAWKWGLQAELPSDHPFANHAPD
jgi:hypothetical protein